MNEFETIVILAAAFIIAYIIGGLRNRKILVGYSRILKAHMQSKSDFLGFRQFGSSGFRATSNMKKESPLSKIEVAVSLVDRENVMHYPLSLITKENDRVSIWASPRTKPSFNLEIYPRGKSIPKRPNGLILDTIKIDQGELEEFYQAATSDKAKAGGVLEDDRFVRVLLRVRPFLRYLLVDKSESRMFLIGRLTEESLGLLLEIVIVLGQIAQ
jgi:hypothetical protein